MEAQSPGATSCPVLKGKSTSFADGVWREVSSYTYAYSSSFASS